MKKEDRNINMWKSNLYKKLTKLGSINYNEEIKIQDSKFLKMERCIVIVAEKIVYYSLDQE